jgi:hypothetical protein
VAEPPPWPKGVVSATLLKKKKKGEKKKGGRSTHGVAGHPLGHGGGSATTIPAGLVVAESPPCGRNHPLLLLSCFFFSFFNRVAETTPLGHWGGSATTRPAGLVVAEPPPWPRGGQPPPVGGSANVGLVVAEPPPWPRGGQPPPVGGSANVVYHWAWQIGNVYMQGS